MKNKGKKLIIVISLAFILIALTIAKVYFQKGKAELGVVKGATSTMKLCYYQKDSNKAYIIEEGDSIQPACICIKGGRVTEFKKDGADINFIEDVVLEDGNYTITLENDQEILTRKFKIDNTPPIVSGLNTTIVRETLTISFENIEDVETATLTFLNKDKELNLYELHKNKKLKKDSNGKESYIIEYKEENKGAYELKVTDAANNIYMKTFRIK